MLGHVFWVFNFIHMGNTDVPFMWQHPEPGKKGTWSKKMDHKQLRATQRAPQIFMCLMGKNSSPHVLKVIK